MSTASSRACDSTRARAIPVRTWAICGPAGGQPLATVAFANETSSGWQQANFPTPVAISAERAVRRVLSRTNVGFYAADSGYFASGGCDNPPLHAVANGAGSERRVSATAPAAFPTQTFNSTNYWVDVVFSTTAAQRHDPAYGRGSGAAEQ